MKFNLSKWIYFGLVFSAAALRVLAAALDASSPAAPGERSVLAAEAEDRGAPAQEAQGDSEQAARVPAPAKSEALKAACAWREHIRRDDEIEPRAPEGYMRKYWPNGMPRSEEPLVSGRFHGIGHYTFANGAVYGDIPWRHGQKHGVFTLYREDGSKEQTLSYRDGVPYGLDEWFAPDGRRTKAWVYLDEKHFVPPEQCEG